MRARASAIGIVALTLAWAAPVLAQAPRQDAIWARSTNGAPITLDGNLNEAAWAAAESKVVKFGVNTTGIPGSGWVITSALSAPFDTAVATLKFLVNGNQLYMGAVVLDKSIGGSGQFNRADGFLMGLKDHAALGFPKPVMEYLYSWWYPRHTDIANPCNPDSAKGLPPIFKGRWAPDPPCDGTGAVILRTAEQIAAWDAVTIVNGISNSDTAQDVSYTVEMRFDLAVMGYDVTDADGDIVEWNIQVYDADWQWPFDNTRFFAGRHWWQGPWGLIAEHNQVRIYARPNVNISSGPVPAIPPEFRVPNAGSMPAPTINGTLTEGVWSLGPSLDIRWDDQSLRDTYAGVGRYRSGQYQPPVNGGQAFIVDGGDATVKCFFKGDWLYMGFDVRDQYVQSYPGVEDRWDGFTVSINHRTELDPLDHNLQGKALAFVVGPGGVASAQKHLPPLVSGGNAQVAMALKPGTVIDTTGTSTDVGYTAELAVNLTSLGYPPGLGDGSIFLGVTLHDGDSFGPPFSPTDSYSTRTWWFREREEQCCPAWAYLDPTMGLVGVDDPSVPSPSRFAALGNFPNPFRNLTRLKFVLPRQAEMSLEVFDLKGRLVAQKSLGRFPAGVHEAPVQLASARAGVYLYRLRVRDPENGSSLATLAGKMMVVR